MNNISSKNYSIADRQFFFECELLSHVVTDHEDKWLSVDGMSGIHSFTFEYDRIDKTPARSTCEIALPVLNELRYTWYKEALVYHKLFINHAYKDVKCDSFKEFCEIYLELPFWQVKDKINHASVVTDLLNLGFTDLPRTQAIAKVLFKVKDFYYKNLKPITYDTDQEEIDIIFEYKQTLSKIWSEFLQYEPVKRTAKRLTDLIKISYPDIFPPAKKRNITLKQDTVNHLNKVAYEREINIDTLITHAIDNFVNRAYLENTIPEPVSESEQLPEYDHDQDIKELVIERQLLDRFKQLCLEYDASYVDMLTKILTNDQYIEEKINSYLLNKSLLDRKSK